MKTVAVICEYNPFHNGHARQLCQMAAVGTTVCVMSGNYVQRGEPAICDKWTRARAAALCGADLVLELPVTYALRSAEGFADGGVEVLERLGCVDALCFGSETGSAERVLSTARLLLSDAFFGRTQAGACHRRELPACARAGRAPPERGGDAAPVSAERHSRRGILQGAAAAGKRDRTDAHPPRRGLSRRNRPERAVGVLPCARRSAGTAASPRPRWRVSPVRRASRPQRGAGVAGASARNARCGVRGAALWLGGLWRRLLRACRTEETLEGIVEAAKTKRYPRTRLMRMLLCAYLGIDEALLRAQAPYIRVLAANERGQAVLRRARKNGAPLLHAGERAPACPYAGLERRADDLFGLFSTKGEYYVNQERQHRLFRPVDAPPCGEK